MMDLNKNISAILSDFTRSMADLAGVVAVLVDNYEREVANNLDLQREIYDLKAKIEEKDKWKDKCDHMAGWLQGIVDYECVEVCKDAFAYDRLMKNLKNAARAGLGLRVLGMEDPYEPVPHRQQESEG